MNQHITKQQWIGLFTAIGLDQAAMQRWHREFESRHPEGHRSFLEWLGLAPEEVKQVRQTSR